MNTKRLAKFYPTLTTTERLRLIHEAGRRGDTAERQRLLDASPCRHYSMLDTGRLEVHLMHLGIIHQAFQLGTASEFWHAQTRASWELQVLAADDPITDEFQFWRHSATVLESLYAIERDGWRLFLQQTGFDDSHFVVPPLAEHGMLTYMDGHATVQPDVEAALEWLLGRVDTLRDTVAKRLKLITPESIADGWHRLVEELTAEES